MIIHIISTNSKLKVCTSTNFHFIYTTLRPPSEYSHFDLPWQSCSFMASKTYYKAESDSLTNVDMSKFDEFVDNNCQHNANNTRVVVRYVHNPCNSSTDWDQQPVDCWLWWQLTLNSLKNCLISPTVSQCHHNCLQPQCCRHNYSI